MALVRWLLFRMMLASGLVELIMMIIAIFVINITIFILVIMILMTINRSVKLTSGCPAWWSLTAMPTHYFSQVNKPTLKVEQFLSEASCLSASQRHWLGLLHFNRIGFTNLVSW